MQKLWLPIVWSFFASACRAVQVRHVTVPRNYRTTGKPVKSIGRNSNGFCFTLAPFTYPSHHWLSDLQSGLLVSWISSRFKWKLALGMLKRDIVQSCCVDCTKVNVVRRTKEVMSYTIMNLLSTKSCSKELISKGVVDGSSPNWTLVADVADCQSHLRFCLATGQQEGVQPCMFILLFVGQAGDLGCFKCPSCAKLYISATCYANFSIMPSALRDNYGPELNWRNIKLA